MAGDYVEEEGEAFEEVVTLRDQMVEVGEDAVDGEVRSKVLATSRGWVVTEFWKENDYEQAILK